MVGRWKSRTPTAASADGASPGDFGASQGHSFKDFLEPEFGLLISLFLGLSTFESALLFVRRTILMSHRNISGLILAPRKQHPEGVEVGSRSVQHSFAHLLTDLVRRDRMRRPAGYRKIVENQ
jgi:hypothetical protein